MKITQPDPFRCSLCGAYFKDIETFSIHLSNHSVEVVDEGPKQVDETENVVDMVPKRAEKTEKFVDRGPKQVDKTENLVNRVPKQVDKMESLVDQGPKQVEKIKNAAKDNQMSNESMFYEKLLVTVQDELETEKANSDVEVLPQVPEVATWAMVAHPNKPVLLAKNMNQGRKRPPPPSYWPKVLGDIKKMRPEKVHKKAKTSKLTPWHPPLVIPKHLSIKPREGSSMENAPDKSGRGPLNQSGSILNPAVTKSKHHNLSSKLNFDEKERAWIEREKSRTFQKFLQTPKQTDR